MAHKLCTGLPCVANSIRPNEVNQELFVLGRDKEYGLCASMPEYLYCVIQSAQGEG